MQFDTIKFLENVQKIHLTKAGEKQFYDAIPDADVREKLIGYVKHANNQRFSSALDKICVNIVGITMFKLLMTKMETTGIFERRGKIKIKKQDEKGKGSRFSYKEWAVKINSDFYEQNGTGKSDRQYYGITEKGEIKTKLKSMSGSMFHEFCHGLHHICGTNFADNEKTICTTHGIESVWGQDEELRTICCINLNNIGYDPICDHCFDFCQSLLKNEQFLPRYSHGGHHGSGEPKKSIKKILCKYIPGSKKFMDGWKEYATR